MNLPDLNHYLKKTELIRQTAEQIIKDFDLFGLEIAFSGSPENAYDELLNQIQPCIINLLKHNQQKFYGLLYRIDLSEEQIDQSVKKNKEKEFSLIISDLIVKRELQKIVIRNYYKGK